MESDMETGDSPLKWEYCPVELLCLIFQNLDTVSLVKCMYICHFWNAAALDTAKEQNLWEDILDKFTVDNSIMTRMKSSDNMSLRDLFENTVLWSHCDKAELSVHSTYDISAVNQLHVYKKNVIIVTSSYVKYFDILKSKLIRDIKLECIDFMENDKIILIVTPGTEDCKTLHLYGKRNVDDFNMFERNLKVVDKVVKFRLEKEGCFVIDDRSQLALYKPKDVDWNVQYLARYYGNSKTVCCLHIFKEQPCILVKWCQLFRANKQGGFDGPLNVCISSGEEEIINLYVKMFHKFGVLYAVQLNEFRFVRKTIDDHNVFLMQCPNLTCATEHGEILLLGYSNGKIEFFMPRAKDEEAALIRQFNITEATGLNLHDKRIKSIDVFDEREQHHVLVATNSQVYHLLLKHTSMDNYLWSVYPERMYV